MLRLPCLWCLAFAAISSANLAHAGKLGDLRERTDADSSSASSADDDEDGDDCELLELLFGGCDSEGTSDSADVGYANSSPRAVEPPLSSQYFYLSYPYAERSPGTLLRKRLPADAELSTCAPEDHACVTRERVAACVDDACFSSETGRSLDAPPLRTARLQAFADVGRDSDGLARGTLGLFADDTSRFALDTRWTYWIEQLPGESSDALWIGDVNLGYGILRLPVLQLTTGAGVRALTGGGKAFGANLSVGAEVYPVRPLVLRAEVDTGNLGGALFWEGQATAGVAILRMELYAGVARFQVADLEFDSAFAGLRLHL